MDDGVVGGGLATWWMNGWFGFIESTIGRLGPTNFCLVDNKRWKMLMPKRMWDASMVLAGLET